MITLLNRLAWLLITLIVIELTLFQENFIFFWIIVWIILKLTLFSKENIQNKFNEEIEKIKSEIRKDIPTEFHKINTPSSIDWAPIESIEQKITYNTPQEEINLFQEKNILENKISPEITKDEPLETFSPSQPQRDIIQENKEKVSLPSQNIFSTIGIFFKDFFAENLMAKIWGILLSLWMIFLMSLVYNEVWPITKIILGFIIWFWIYAIWILLWRKWLKNESMILLWVWIVINYIVIFSWRFLIGDDGLLSSSITFIFLILNTLFSLFTSFIYQSRNLLFFSVIIAYIVPLITWFNESKYSFIIMVWYNIIITLWTFAISNFYKKIDTQLALQLFYTWVVWANILFIFIPSSESIGVATKIIWFTFITLLSLFWIYKNNYKNHILWFLWIAYISLAIILWVWSVYFNPLIEISYIFSLITILLSSIFFIIAWLGTTPLWLLFVPIIFIFLFLLNSQLLFWFFIIPLFLIIYLWIFAFLSTKNFISSSFKYIFIIFIWIFLSTSNIFLLTTHWDIDTFSFYSIVCSAFIFIISTYYLSTKKDLNYLYTIWTLTGIVLIAPLIKISWEFMYGSIFAVTLFAILNFMFPLFSKNLLQNKFTNIILWIILWIIFSAIQIYSYWEIYFPWISLWIAYSIWAIIYFIWWFILFKKMEVTFTPTENKNSESKTNLILSYFAISISLFSIAISLLFTNTPFIISMAYLFEWIIALYFAQRVNNVKIYIAWIILMFLWIIKYLYIFIFLSSQLWYNDIISLIWISIALFLWVIFVKKLNNNLNIFIRLLHIVWLFLVYFSLNTIISNTYHSIFWWYEFILAWIFLLWLWVIYNSIKDSFLKNTYIWTVSFLIGSHVLSTYIINPYYYNYIFSIIIVLIVFIELFIYKQKKYFNYLVSIFVWYFFIITSIYIYYITKDSFYLTIYWWILAIIWIHIGTKKHHYLRITWLYFLIITLIKIIYYDIWNYVDNWIIRVIACMFIWSLMIYISHFYKKHNLSIKKDLFIEINVSKHLPTQENTITSNWVQEIKNEQLINIKIKNIDVSEIERIKFILNNWDFFQIKSKNLFKIVKLVLIHHNKTQFNPNELNDIYEYTINNYQTDLNEADYKKLTSLIKQFVSIGGKIEIINKL